MQIGLYIVGDEILSGRRQDQHLTKIIDILRIRGLELAWSSYLRDDSRQLAQAYRHTLNSDSLVVSCGGIGGTPDDHTRQAVALALGVELVLHPQAAELIRQRCLKTGNPVTPERLRMAELPVGAELIPNPYNGIAGFSVQQHYFVPGFPIMAWPMIEWVLDTHYSHLFHTQLKHTCSLLVYGAMEAALTPLMEQIETTYPTVRVFSLPSLGQDGQRQHIDLGVKGNSPEIDSAFLLLKNGLDDLQVEYQETKK